MYSLISSNSYCSKFSIYFFCRHVLRQFQMAQLHEDALVRQKYRMHHQVTLPVMIAVQHAHIIVLVKSVTKTLLKVFQIHTYLLIFMLTVTLNIINSFLVCAYSLAFIIILLRAIYLKNVY